MSRGFRPLWVAALALLLAFRMALAQSQQEAILHFVRGDYAAALPGIRNGAERGDAISQFMLGSMYADGRGVPKDERLAVFWYSKAAEQGQADAQYNLGTWYAAGRGVPEDDRLAVFWYRMAAEQGYALAQLALGNMYFSGIRVPNDDRLAVHWYRQAAEQGQANAQYNLGVMHVDGRGVPKDEQTAYFWLILSSAQGNQEARYLRDRLERRITPHQRAAAEAAARAWRPTTASQAAPSAPTKDVPVTLPAPTSTGTAFRIATDRFATNHHVVEDCRRVHVDGTAAQVGAIDRRMDLALLSAPVGGAIATLRTRRPQIGEAVTVTGFPLQGLLSGFQVTTGTLSSLSGLGGDTSQFQITAPVQPGNSGGPVLDAAGRVMGVVVSKLDAIRTARVTGDIPQNVNFAVGGNALRAFLDANDVNYQTSEVERPLPTTTVAQQAQGFTLRVECWK